MLLLPIFLSCCVATGDICAMAAAGELDLNFIGVADQHTPGATVVFVASQAAAPARDGNIAILEEYDVAVQKNTLEACQLFIMRHPSHPNPALARQRIQSLQEVNDKD